MPDGNIWTASNLDYWYLEDVGTYYDNADTEPFPNAGKLYSYNEIINIIPPGWRLPTLEEFTWIKDNISPAKLKISPWEGPITNTNSTGFSLRPAGRQLDTGTYSGINTIAQLATSTSQTTNNNKVYVFMLSNTNSITLATTNKDSRSSIRLIKITS